jgi:hypothetical protein
MNEQPSGLALRRLGRSALGPLDRRLELLHHHLDEVAQQLERSVDGGELRQLLLETLAELRAQSTATLELARTLQTFAEAMATRFETIAASIDAASSTAPDPNA